MGSSANAASAEFLSAFRAQARDSALSFAGFMELALYHPTFGYYRRDRPRVGYGRGTDFFTASTSGAVFGELVAAACVNLLGAEAARESTFIEIGAETRTGILADVQHPFRSTQTIAVGEPLEFSGACVVFSNELFDAQPFRRFVFRDDRWRELGVAVNHDALVEVDLPDNPLPTFLPQRASEGYIIDAPTASVTLLERIVAAPWRGLFVACDYGKSWRELTEACPAGTARAYRNHQQSNDLLASPSEQDLTCHICWDWLADGLSRNGFASPTVESHESFFIRHATRYIAEVSSADAAQFSRRKLSLLQLLHPAQLGQKFQVLHALRR
jgi:SAM-dependent MidA family methyltransferase